MACIYFTIFSTLLGLLSELEPFPVVQSFDFLNMRAGVPKDGKLGFDLRAWLFGANISPKTIIVGTSPA